MKNYNFESKRVQEIVGEIISRGVHMMELLTEQKFDTDSIYYHLAWYINGAKDVLICDNTVSSNDFREAQEIFDAFMNEAVEKIGYNNWSRL